MNLSQSPRKQDNISQLNGFRSGTKTPTKTKLTKKGRKSEMIQCSVQSATYSGMDEKSSLSDRKNKLRMMQETGFDILQLYIEIG